MVFLCADDYGLYGSTTTHIQKCLEKGALNKVSIFPNFEKFDLKEITKNDKVKVSLHLNLVEGKCMADANEIHLLADANGNFKHTFGGLLRLNIFRAKELETQLYQEIRAQILCWKSSLPEGVSFCIDSHQHTHMIPAVFRTLLKVLRDEKIDLKYMRIPVESILPFLKTPSLYFTYRPINIVKQWLLNFLWLLNKKEADANDIHLSCFFGILFSGKMDERRVRKILPKYIKLAEKAGKDLEVLFHPGYRDEDQSDLENKNIVFKKFYVSANRKTEFDSVIKINERSVQE